VTGRRWQGDDLDRLLERGGGEWVDLKRSRYRGLVLFLVALSPFLCSLLITLIQIIRFSR
jgi:hypothetical protein